MPEVPRPAGGSEPADAHGPVGFDVSKTGVAIDTNIKPKANPEQAKKEEQKKPQISSAPAGSVPAVQNNQ